MTDKRIEILRDMPVNKAIQKLSLPAIIGFMVMGLYTVADTVFISRWNYRGAAAVQVIFPVMMIASAIGLAFGVGSGSYLSRLLGEEKQTRAKEVLSTSLFSAVCIAAVYIIIAILNLDTVVMLFGATGTIIPLAIEYGFYIILGALFVVPSMVLNNTLRAEGSARYSMIGMVAGTALNLILDPIFIFTLNLGLKGAAFATMFSQAVTCAVLLHFYLRKKTVLEIALRHIRFELSIYKEVFKIGIPTFFKQLLVSLSMAVFNKIATSVGGDYLLSAMSITMKVVGLPTFFIFGMGHGLQPVVGYNFGAKNKERLLAAQRYGMKATFLGAALSAGVLLILARPITLLFTNEAPVITFAVLSLRLMSLGLMFTAISNTVAIVYQAIGNGKAALLFSVLRQGILFIPSIIILGRVYSGVGVMLAQPVADFITFVISIIVYIPFVKKEKRLLQS